MEHSDHRLIGMQLGTCVLEKLIGSGGMGMVYLAHQLRPTREVAVKVLKIGGVVQSETNQEFLARFRREANVIAQLDHVNILPIYEYGEQGGIAYLVMPYLAGGSLRDLLQRRRKLSPREALSYIEQAAAALQYAHTHKIVHRDIKPGNMLFHTDGRLVLVDFGIAHIMREDGEVLADSLTSSAHFLGSVEYMAPEMVSGQQIDRRADLYELGIVLFQMLTGRVPFRGSSPFIIAARHVHDEPPLPSSLNPALGPAIDAVVMKAIAKQPEERYASASEFAQALREAVELPEAAIRPTAEDKPFSTQPPAFAPIDTVIRQSRSAHPEFAPQEIATSEVPSPPHTDQIVRQEQSDTSYPTPPPVGSGTPPLVGPDSLVGYTRPPSYGWIKALIVCALLLIALSIGVLLAPSIISLAHLPVSPRATSPASTQALPTATLPVTPTETAEQKAQDVVQQYYNDINQQNFQAAYQLWSADYRNTHSFQNFARGYAPTMHVDLAFGNATTSGNGTVIVPLTIYATDRTDTGTQVKAYQGTYIIGQDSGALRLLSANFQPIGTEVSPTPTAQNQQQAQQVVQNYYDALNRHDYQSAYHLWSADFQRDHPYQQFANGFAATLHDTVSFGAIAQLADTVYRVDVTVTATEKASNGSSTTTSTYTGSYIIGQQKGTLLLMTADLQKANRP